MTIHPEHRSPDQASATVCLTFDNLGDAAEIELGLLPEDVAVGQHESVLGGLPRILDTLARNKVSATFFVEGWNGDYYADALRAIVDAGHEVAFHGWRHESWASLTPDDVAVLTDRSLNALQPYVGHCVGLRPPGGYIPDGAAAILAARGIEYVSPAGGSPGVDDGLATLPFEWTSVDALFFEPLMHGARLKILGDPAVAPAAMWRRSLQRALDGLAAGNQYLNVIFHAYLLTQDAARMSVLEWFVDQCASNPAITMKTARDYARSIASVELAKQRIDHDSCI